MSSFACLLLLAFALLARREGDRGGGWFWKAWKGRFATGVFATFLILALCATEGGFDPLVAVLALLLLLVGPIRLFPRLEVPAFLRSRAATLFAGLGTAAVTGFIWNSLDPVARFHDEAAYLLQARLFASGRWTGLARPLPEFFEQMQVFVTPVLASKYPPGHSLVLVPGIWLGMPALMPLILNGLAGSLIFAHARRLAGGWVGLMTWLLWVGAPGTMVYRASYFSQNTTTVLWLLALWSLREWYSYQSRGWLVLLAACLGFGAITRPMTMFALALPIGVVMIHQVRITRRWSDIALSSIVVGLILGFGVLWSIRTIGEWKTSPYREYSRVYFPYEWTGFGVRRDTPIRHIPPGMTAFDRDFRRLHAEHRVGTLADTVINRLARVFADQWSQGRQLLKAFALLGALTVCAEGVFAMASAASLVIAHLFMAHFFSWTVYYVEIQPVLSFLTAFGVCGVIASTLVILKNSRFRAPAYRLGTAGLGLTLTAGLFLSVAEAKENRQVGAAEQTAFRDSVALLPDPRLIVFVRYGRNHDPHRNLVVNEPDLESAKAWVVHDLGARNSQLIALAPDRRPYLFDETSRVFSIIARE